MDTEKSFLLGATEKMTGIWVNENKPRPSPPVYSLEESLGCLKRGIQNILQHEQELPPSSIPDGIYVSALDMHPQSIAMGYFPLPFAREFGFRILGSKPTKIRPRKVRKRESIIETTPDDDSRTTNRIFLAGLRRSYEECYDFLCRDVSAIKALPYKQTLRYTLCRTEALEPIQPTQKIICGKTELHPGKQKLFEIILHDSDHSKDESLVLTLFLKYLHEVEKRAELKNQICTEHLRFLSVICDADSLIDIAKFNYLRAVRPMPLLRPTVDPFLRKTTAKFHIANNLRPQSDRVKVAIFDGGNCADSPTHRFTQIHANQSAKPIPEAVQHGTMVTSAFLFGHLQNQQPSPPVCSIDHYQVFDDKTLSSSDPDLIAVLRIISDAVENVSYDFANLSIGPDLPISDDEVHAWTAVIDHLSSSRDIVFFLAAGNNGADVVKEMARIQVPSDSVHAITVGAANTQLDDWGRAEYSALGPGRTFAIKPDLLAFGGSLDSPFCALGPKGMLFNTAGTSFAAPLAMRMAASIKAAFDDRISNLSIKTLLIHHAERRGVQEHDYLGHGNGRLANGIDSYIVCQQGSVTVLYEFEVDHSDRYKRIMIPYVDDLQGYVDLRATLCYTCCVDEHMPYDYAQTGLQILFRKDVTDIAETGEGKLRLNAETDSFFKEHNKYKSEISRRSEDKKWEAVRTGRRRFRSDSLNNPIFDFHFLSRSSGASSASLQKTPVSLAITLECKNVPNLHSLVMHRYQMQPITPVIDLQVRL